MGLISTSAIVLIQSSVGWDERGAATASNVFSRNLGSTFGAAVLGGVLNATLANQGAASSGFDEVRHLLNGAGGPAVDPAVLAALGSGLHLTFWAMFLITVSAFAASALVPRVKLPLPAE